MLRSMTGFGRYLVENAGGIQQWEIKSVNNRFLDFKWRLPLNCRCLEARLEKIARRHAGRGRVEICLGMQYSPEFAPRPNFDAAQARSMLRDVDDLALSRGDEFVPDYSRLLSIPALWGDQLAELDEDAVAGIENGLCLALEDWNESRAAEGRALGADIQSRILKMDEWLKLIESRAPAIREERAKALKERLQEAMAQNAQELEEGRYLQEVVLLADRLDVSEELTRLATHLDRLSELLDIGGDVGRRLDFTLQECFREINTCGNKLPDVQLSGVVVDFKNELEKCREQVQNLE